MLHFTAIDNPGRGPLNFALSLSSLDRYSKSSDRPGLQFMSGSKLILERQANTKEIGRAHV